MLVELKCRGCGGPISVGDDKVDIPQGERVGEVKPGCVVKCPHCGKEYINDGNREDILVFHSKVVVAAERGSVAIGGNVSGSTIITGKRRLDDD